MSNTLPPTPNVLDAARSMVSGNMHTTMRDMIQRYGDVVRLRFAGRTWYALNHPEHIERVLVGTERDFIKGEIGKDHGPVTDFLFGNGLVTSDGDFWRRQRRLAQPAFHRERIAAYGETMLVLARRMLATWRAGEPFDIGVAMRRLTLAIVAETLFGEDIEASGAATRFGAAFEVLMDVYAHGNKEWTGLRGLLYNGQRKRYEAAKHELDQTVAGLIAQHHAAGNRGDLLSMLMLARDEDGSQMTDRQLRDEVMTLVIAGHDTTSATLTWALYLLSQHPDIQRTLLEELQTVVGARELTVGDVPNLPFLNAVIKETMRLYPPVPDLAREAACDTTIGPYHVPIGTVLLMSPWVVHRDPRWYTQAEQFVPARWLGETERQNPKYAFFPFGGGPRLCIGNNFSLLEAALVLAEITRHFTLSPVSGQTIAPEMRTMRPKHGLLVVSRPRLAS